MAMQEQVVAPELPTPLPTGKVTFEEFLAWLDEDVRAEWVDGEIELMTTPASLEHQVVGGFLYRLVAGFVEAGDLGTVLAPPFLVKLPLRPSGREPDLIFVAREHEARFQQTYLDGAPDLVLEMVSTDSVARDRGEKFAEYEAAGIPEYWLIDPDRRQADFYVMTERGLYQEASLDADGRLHSHVLPGFWIKPSWLWMRPLPPVATCLKDILE